MRWKDIPQFTRAGQWECDFSPERLVEFVREHQEMYGLQLDPEFQRAHVWTEAQQIAYIEFFLRGGLSARVIYFNYPSWKHEKQRGYNDFVIVDGKQRVEAWRRFQANEIPAFGTLCRDFKGSQHGLYNSLRVNVNDLQTEAEVLQWYLDFNGGGVVHSEQELDRVRALLAEAQARAAPGTRKTRRKKV